MSWLNPVRFDKLSKRAAKALKVILRNADVSITDAEELLRSGDSNRAMISFGCDESVEVLDSRALASILSKQLGSADSSVAYSTAEARALILRYSSTPTKVTIDAHGLLRLAKNEIYDPAADARRGAEAQRTPPNRPKSSSSSSSRRRNGDKAQLSEGLASASSRQELDLFVGLEVEARYRKGQQFYKAKVTKVYPNGNVDLDYDDGDSEEAVKPKYVRLPQQ